MCIILMSDLKLFVIIHTINYDEIFTHLNEKKKRDPRRKKGKII